MLKAKISVTSALVASLIFVYFSATEKSYSSEPELDSQVQANVKKLLETRQCIRCNLQGANLRWMNIRGVNLQGANLRKADMGALHGTDLSGANLSGATLNGLGLVDVDLRGANLENAIIVPVTMGNAKIDRTTKIGYKFRLVWEIFNHGAEGKDLRGVDLRGAFLFNANLRGANLEGADLRGIYLRGADLSNANLRYANEDWTPSPGLANSGSISAYLCNTTLPNGTVSMRNCKQQACPVGFSKDIFNILRPYYSCKSEGR